ncbi:MAG TPA: DNA translocase FtsK 4TM domain-containing protein [Kofleriaceae bacterium]|nr:DNA translocase FtsK 4TM domain-containing protein [Kofleriaceae bacterium]
MSKNRRVKRPARAAKAAKAVKGSPSPARRRAPGEAGRSREVVGIISLGTSIFVVCALLSLQIGDGRLMGPFGRSIASAVYALGGMCSYLIAAGLVVIAIRLLTDREPALQRNEALGVGLGLLSLATLVHLFGAGYRVSGMSPGGVLGEHLAEVLRAVISTAGTALVSVTGLVMAAVIGTPLRMKTVLGAIGRAGGWIWAGMSEAGRAVGSAVMGIGAFCGEVVRAILPERDRDEYGEREARFTDADYDAYELDQEMDAVPQPPIIDARSSAAVAAPISGDTERISEEDLARTLAAARAEAATTKLATVAADADQEVSDEDVESEEEVDQDEEIILLTPKSAGSKAASKAEPVIVESKFKHKDAKEIAAKEKELDAERRQFIPLGGGTYELPPINMLDYDATQQDNVDREAMLELSARLTQTLEHYKIKGEVVAIRPGPVVTMYEFSPAPGTRLNKIVSLADDLAMSLEALRVRIVAPIPGKAAVGIEVPNKTRETVFLKEILADDVFRKGTAKLPLAMGKDIEGAPVVVDLAKMPHLLVAGTTGSGKSVSVNSMIASLLYHCTPDEVRMIMVDPKMLELSIYEGIPHLLLPVVTDPKKANLALRWAVEEMERRYQLLSDMRVRDIATFNKKLVKLHAKYEAEQLKAAAAEAERIAEEGDDEVEVTEERQLSLELEPPPQKLPYIVVIIDEFADLMMCAPKEVETSVARIAQKARAAGIHLVLATQRPSVNVITGLIKANFPSRAAFHVTAKVDSRTILDQGGAERLLGAGDMLFSDRGAAPRRIHGCFVDEDEIGRVVDFLKTQGKPVYNLDILRPRDEDGEDGPEAPADDELDEMYDRAVAIVQETRQVSISMLQRRLRVGYNRAARMVECMEAQSVVSQADHQNRREVLLPPAA